MVALKVKLVCDVHKDKLVNEVVGEKSVGASG